MQFFATTAKNIEPLLLEELKNFKAKGVKGTHLGVAFEGDIDVAYRACLWSRLAHHIFLELKIFEAPTRESLYQAVKSIRWDQHFKETQTFRIDVSGKHPTLTHPHFIAQIAKDAIVDQFRTKTGKRPSIEADRPDIVLQLHVRENRFVLYLDLSGESLHKRGIRTETGVAPLKETLAAALLIRAGWYNEGARSLEDPGRILLDPMCGAGTLLLEGAMMAYDIAPGLYRTYFGFMGWKQHNSELWKKLIQEAKLRQQEALHNVTTSFVGFDINARTLSACEQNFRKLGLIKNVRLEKRNAWELDSRLYENNKSGLLITNPPYGKRLMSGQDAEIEALYAKLGEAIKQHLQGWKMAIFAENTVPVKAVKMRPAKQYQFLNGALECTLITFMIQPENYWRTHQNEPTSPDSSNPA